MGVCVCVWVCDVCMVCVGVGLKGGCDVYVIRVGVMYVCMYDVWVWVYGCVGGLVCGVYEQCIWVLAWV